MGSLAAVFGGAPPREAVPRRRGLAALDSPHGSLLVTEAGTRKRASLVVVAGDEALSTFDRGGLEPPECDTTACREVLTGESHTLKRALTDPRLPSGIGNAYSDEILHRARLSPLELTRRLSPEETERLHRSVREVLAEWTVRFTSELEGGFPEKVTALREGMAGHGRYRRPCPAC
jgi:formamidopyrimidine-DNA glycosylase